jgi:hypothetical protein
MRKHRGSLTTNASKANGRAMAIRRKDDPQVGHSWFRTDRIAQDGGKWFFHTREGTIEGPFECRMSAVNQLEMYVRLAINDFLDTYPR